MLHQKLTPFFSGKNSKICVLSRDYTGELIPYRQIYNPRGNWLVRGIGRLDFDGAVHWTENSYIETIPGVWITSSEEDFVLHPGDLVPEQIGTGADLQKILDARYEALPMEAERNEDGGYHVPDKQHCSKEVVEDLAGPVYRFIWSDRARAAQDEYRRRDVCVYFEPEIAKKSNQLWYFPESDEDAFELHPVMAGAAEPNTGGVRESDRRCPLLLWEGPASGITCNYVKSILQIRSELSLTPCSVNKKHKEFSV